MEFCLQSALSESILIFKQMYQLTFQAANSVSLVTQDSLLIRPDLNHSVDVPNFDVIVLEGMKKSQPFT